MKIKIAVPVFFFSLFYLLTSWVEYSFNFLTWSLFTTPTGRFCSIILVALIVLGVWFTFGVLSTMDRRKKTIKSHKEFVDDLQDLLKKTAEKNAARTEEPTLRKS